ncbi:hypothetical protein VTK26DRAFT_247 [Humicola hyalothermophila]
MEGQPRKHKNPKPHHPHHVVPPHETGYTDEAAEECHDLIYRAEEEAHLHEPEALHSTESTGASGSGSTRAPKKTGGLEKESGGHGGAAEKMAHTGKNIKETVGEKVGHMKDSMSHGMSK